MTALIFLVLAVAMILAAVGNRSLAIAAFSVGFVLAALWFDYHIYDPLTVAF